MDEPAPKQLKSIKIDSPDSIDSIICKNHKDGKWQADYTQVAIQISLTATMIAQDKLIN